MSAVIDSNDMIKRLYDKQNAYAQWFSKSTSNAERAIISRNGL